MKSFINDDFLLTGASAKRLYHEYAEHEPILDFHNHLPAQLIAENHQFTDLFEIWLKGDHYKWRAMRANGVPERLITGDASPQEKFFAWAETVPHTLGNPLYHWTHLELTRDFGITDLLNEETAPAIWLTSNEKLRSLRVHDILKNHRVNALCTTDDPTDSLEHHVRINKGNFGFRMFPTFRPDAALLVHQPAGFRTWIERLEKITHSIRTLDDLLNALKMRHDAFHYVGGRLSDHGLESAYSEPCSHDEADRIFQTSLAGNGCFKADQILYASYMMVQFGKWDADSGWTKQLHLGALRNTNQRLRKSLGADAGVDSIGDFPQAESLARYLNSLDETDQLPKTILYNLNPADNYVFGSMIGNFQSGATPGKIQLGSAWWFMDQKEGMEWQLKALANLGLLSRFVGMVTDSRSFLSFPRHEYFRRTLCGWLGASIDAGDLPDDLAFVGALVKRICYSNARDYLNFPE